MAPYAATNRKAPVGCGALIYNYRYPHGRGELPRAVVEEAFTKWNYGWESLVHCGCPLGCGSNEDESKLNGTLLCLFNISACTLDNTYQCRFPYLRLKVDFHSENQINYGENN
ncbi:unnamed protein product [Cylicocyclus nassatus]|uniref:Uncharacterized protein n=1 Tax=Cylicocyclus nassatus TaxID=53992 RepID=A0AA36DMD3_CYLNA|nr:unnamed protein product [Cylicocyclus nassatus]